MILSFFSVKIIPGSYIMYELKLYYSYIFITQSYCIFQRCFLSGCHRSAISPSFS